MIQLIKKNKGFRYFWIASSVSTIGDYIDDIAFAQLVYFITESTLLSSYVFAIKIICSILGIFTSTFVDRHEKKNIIILSSLFQGITLLILFGICSFNKANTIILMIIVTIQSIFSSFVTPARNAMIMNLVDKEELINARASMSVASSIIELSSYAFSGLLISFLGLKSAILLDSITFFVSIVLLTRVEEKNSLEDNVNASNPFLTDVKNGFQFVLTSKVILSVVLVTFMGNAATAPVDALFPAYIQQNNLPIWFYSMFMITTSVGGLIGGYLITFLQKKIGYNYLLGIGFLIGGIGIILLNLPKIGVLILSGMLIGVSVSLVSVINSVIIQTQAPLDMQARAFSFFSCISYIACPLGMIFSGGLGEKYPMKTVFPIFGIVLIIAAIYSSLVIKTKEMECR